MLFSAQDYVLFHDGADSLILAVTVQSNDNKLKVKLLHVFKSPELIIYKLMRVLLQELVILHWKKNHIQQKSKINAFQ